MLWFRNRRIEPILRPEPQNMRDSFCFVLLYHIGLGFVYRFAVRVSALFVFIGGVRCCFVSLRFGHVNFVCLLVILPCLLHRCHSGQDVFCFVKLVVSHPSSRYHTPTGITKTKRVNKNIWQQQQQHRTSSNLVRETDLCSRRGVESSQL